MQNTLPIDWKRLATIFGLVLTLGAAGSAGATMGYAAATQEETQEEPCVEKVLKDDGGECSHPEHLLKTHKSGSYTRFTCQCLGKKLAAPEPTLETVTVPTVQLIDPIIGVKIHNLSWDIRLLNERLNEIEEIKAPVISIDDDPVPPYGRWLYGQPIYPKASPQ